MKNLGTYPFRIAVHGFRFICIWLVKKVWGSLEKQSMDLTKMLNISQ